jgi:hypothetical protein
MIDRGYLERLASDFSAQIREYENNAAAARGALQVVQHLIEKYEAGAVAVSAAPVQEEDRITVKDESNGSTKE